MDEIRAIPWNGFNAVSTFSGCGGSSTGYRMAGFRMLWASEFIEAAQESYRANMAPYTTLDGRDIREVTAAELLAACGLDVGEIDLFDGSPPCASFSSAGSREAGWGREKKYSDTVQRTDDLFYEYSRLIRETQPRTFVAENVAGLVKGVAKGYFIRIMEELKGCGYRVRAKLLDAQWLGVPQGRQRLIFIGVRNDLETDPVFPAPLPYRYSVRDAIGATQVVTLNGFDGHRISPAGDPVPTVTASGIGRAHARSEVAVENAPVGERDPETGHDLSIARYAIGREWAKLRPGQSSEKYFQLTRVDDAKPCPTVTQRGGDVTAASVTHSTVARKFTIAEVRRLCAFPDDFVLTGNYEQRWERMGRAVPPVMMSHVAATVRDRILIPLREAS